MGYTIKRVPTDFHHPLEEPWPGYVNPHIPGICAGCEGSGDSPEAKHLKDLWYGNAPFRPEDRGSRPFLPTDPQIQTIAKRNMRRMPLGMRVQREAERLAGIFNHCWRHHLNADDVAALVAKGRLQELTHDFTPGRGWSPKQPAHHPTPEEVNTWSLQFFGHDAINAWTVIGAECERLGVPSTCGECDGTGEAWETEELRQAAEAWTPTEPPTGEGYQAWETVTEGSPVTPVFLTPESLARHMALRYPSGECPLDVDEGMWLAFILGPKETR